MNTHKQSPWWRAMKLASARWTAVDGDQRAAAFACYLLLIVENHRSDFPWSPMWQCVYMDTGPGKSRIERRLVGETDGGGFGSINRVGQHPMAKPADLRQIFLTLVA